MRTGWDDDLLLEEVAEEIGDPGAHLHERLDLAEADRAQRAVQAGGIRGRIVLLPN
jgi:hypothetical protein